ncbi:unnamed protein product [Rhizophagus irregularis]|nr:unnamed protein product [Rhizophagus irregularis]
MLFQEFLYAFTMTPGVAQRGLIKIHKVSDDDDAVFEGVRKVLDDDDAMLEGVRKVFDNGAVKDGIFSNEFNELNSLLVIIKYSYVHV